MKSNLVSILFILPLIAQAQITKDSSIVLQPIALKVHFAKQSMLSTTAAIHTLDEKTITQQQPTSILASINTISGIRMEERSPGSYRLAVRGSLMRSPFGIRNTKIYIDEFPLTDASGNTYLNLIDPFFLQQINVIKGPDGSLYGANTGGVLRMYPKSFGDSKENLTFNSSAGSFGLFQEQLSIQKKLSNRYQLGINQSFTRSDGYRNQTALNKKSFQTAQQWQYKPDNQIRLFALYSNLGYETPGGLTQAQYEENPKQARPATGSNPSAEEQKSAIYNKTLFAGLAHSSSLTNNLFHNISIYGSFTNFKNPFITNYEIRHENNLGLRTFLSWEHTHHSNIVQMQLGLETSIGKTKISNFDNIKGQKADLQAKDKLNNESLNIFYRAQIEIIKNWNIEGSLGLNNHNIDFSSYYPVQEEGKIDFGATWMPRLASSYTYNNMAWRLSYAKGYSTPTLAEVRASDNIINRNLNAEKGNNYEIGYKIRSTNQKWIFDIAAYNFKMDNGIIRQLDDTGNEFYANVGEMNQKGIEGTLWFLQPIKYTFLHAINYQTAISYNHYRFGHYEMNGNNLNGKRITAVPDWVWTNTLYICLTKNIQWNIYHNYTSSSPLNDINTVFSTKYNLIQTKINWKKKISTYEPTLYFGIDNLLNEKYSLGNDINAFGGRYYNAAPPINYYAGILITI